MYVVYVCIYTVRTYVYMYVCMYVSVCMCVFPTSFAIRRYNLYFTGFVLFGVFCGVLILFSALVIVHCHSICILVNNTQFPRTYLAMYISLLNIHILFSMLYQKVMSS